MKHTEAPDSKYKMAEGVGLVTTETESATHMGSGALTWERFGIHLQAALWRPLPMLARSRPTVRDTDSTTAVWPCRWWCRFEPSSFVAGGHNASTHAKQSGGADIHGPRKMYRFVSISFLFLHNHNQYRDSHVANHSSSNLSSHPPLFNLLIQPLYITLQLYSRHLWCKLSHCQL